MKRYRFDATAGQPLDVFNSTGFTFSKLLWLNEDAGDLKISCAHLQPGGVIGHHPATVPQLLIVVQGQGMVRGAGSGAGSGAEDLAIAIHAGEMALWRAGEWHETRTEAGLMALIVECPALRVEDVIAVPLD